MAAQARPCWLLGAAGCWHAGMLMLMHVYFDVVIVYIRDLEHFFCFS